MSLFARILSHGFALVVVVLLGLGLIYRGDLFPGMELPEFMAFERAADSGTRDTSGSVTRDEAVSAGDDQAPGPVDRQSISDDAGSAQETLTGTADTMTDPSMTAADDGAPVSPVEDGTRAPAMPADDVTGNDEADVDEETEEADPVIREIPAAAPTTDQSTLTDPQTRAVTPPPVAPVEPAAEADLVAPAATKVITRDPAAQPVTATDSASDVSESVDTAAVAGSTAIDQPVDAAVTASKPAESPYRLLAAAREAYWLRDYATAEQKYQAMIELDPTNPDGFGELGNMYFSQGKWEQASATYFEAGKRLADEGLLEQARQLVDVLKGLQGTQAKTLEKYIADKSATTQ